MLISQQDHFSVPGVQFALLFHIYWSDLLLPMMLFPFLHCLKKNLTPSGASKWKGPKYRSFHIKAKQTREFLCRGILRTTD